MKKYPYPYKNNEYGFDEESYMNVGSANDCTGLIAASPVNDEEYDSYRELYDFLPSDNTKIPHPD